MNKLSYSHYFIPRGSQALKQKRFASVGVKPGPIDCEGDLLTFKPPQ